jgi:hypothetical protein
MIRKKASPSGATESVFSTNITQVVGEVIKFVNKMDADQGGTGFVTRSSRYSG